MLKACLNSDYTFFVIHPESAILLAFNQKLNKFVCFCTISNDYCVHAVDQLLSEIIYHTNHCNQWQKSLDHSILAQIPICISPHMFQTC